MGDQGTRPSQDIAGVAVGHVPIQSILAIVGGERAGKIVGCSVGPLKCQVEVWLNIRDRCGGVVGPELLL